MACAEQGGNEKGGLEARGEARIHKGASSCGGDGIVGQASLSVPQSVQLAQKMRIIRMNFVGWQFSVGDEKKTSNKSLINVVCICIRLIGT
jgi:hypothetical protein